MILVINICKEELHYFEFVQPIENVLIEGKERYFVKHYKELSKKDLEKIDKVIICGTSLQDNQFIEDVDKFSWIKNFDKPILGICGGMHIIGLLFGGKLKRKTEIGYEFENMKKEFLGLKKDERYELYHLHNNYVEFCKDFENFTTNKVRQAVKHKEKEIYGVLFHPEVRSCEIISEFIKK